MMDYKITTNGRRLKRVDLEMRMTDYSDWAHIKKYIVPSYSQEQYNQECNQALQTRMLNDPKYRRLFDRCDGEIVWRTDSQEDIMSGITTRRVRASFYIDEAEYLVHILGE